MYVNIYIYICMYVPYIRTEDRRVPFGIPLFLFGNLCSDPTLGMFRDLCQTIGKP